MATDAHGVIFFSDADGTVLRRIGLDGRVTTIAGAAGDARVKDGVGKKARLSFLLCMAVHKDGTVYFADRGQDSATNQWPNTLLRSVSLSGRVRTLGSMDARLPPQPAKPRGVARPPQRAMTPNSGGEPQPFKAAQATESGASMIVGPMPSSMLCLENGDLLVSDQNLNCLLVAHREPPFVVYAGDPGEVGRRDGPKAQAQFFWPEGLAQGPDGSVYVADKGNDCIRRISPGGDVTTIAGGAAGVEFKEGRGTEACLKQPTRIVNGWKGCLYVLEGDRVAIRRVSAQREVTSWVGDDQSDYGGALDGPVRNARFGEIAQLLGLPDGACLVADRDNLLRRVSPDGSVQTIGSLMEDETGKLLDGWLVPPLFRNPTHLALAEDGSVHFLDDDGSDGVALHRIVSEAIVETLFSSGKLFHEPLRGVSGIARGWDRDWLVLGDGGLELLRIKAGEPVTPLNPVEIPSEVQASFSAFGHDGILTRDLVSDLIYGLSDGTRTGGSGSGFVFTLDRAGRVKLLAGEPGERPWKLFRASPRRTYDGQGREARFIRPELIAPHPEGGIVLLDEGNTLRKVTSTGLVTTLVPSLLALGIQSKLDVGCIQGIACDAGGAMYLADYCNHVIFKIEQGVLSVYAGKHEEEGSADGPRLSARFNAPCALAIAPDGNLYIADSHNGTVRMISRSGQVSTRAGAASPD